jgi:Zn-finger nucleic acid-binding protein
MADTAETLGKVTFFDPFAAEGIQEFNPLQSYEIAKQRYSNNEVEHDYSADMFVADAEALVFDSQFAGMMEQAALIEADMHARCGGHDPSLQSSVQQSSLFGKKEHYSHDDHAGHDHSSDDYDSNDTSLAKSKKKKKKVREGLSVILARLFTQKP